MEDLDIAAVVHRSIRGVFALVSRTLFIQVVTFVVNFLLTVYLSPSIFGIYFAVSAVIAILSYFSDIGLAAALVQKKENLTREDLTTTFTVQQGLVIGVCIITLLVSPYIGKIYRLDNSGFVLLTALVVAFFLSSLKTIPSILLERELRFDKWAIPQVVETLVYNVVVLFCAVKGMGISSFTWAVLARGISGVITMYIISPWRISIGFSFPTLKRLLSFGFPFLGNSILGLIKDDLLIAYTGWVLPASQLGFIGFAQKWALSPLRLVSDNVIRIAFPSFARLQHDEKHLGKAVEKSLFASSFLIFPSLVGLVMLAPTFIMIIPKYHKWEPALFSLALFAVNAALSAISTPLTNVLNAIGKIKTTLYLMIFWTVTTWALTPLAMYWYGFNGFAFVSGLISLSVVLVVIVSQKYINFSVKPLLAPSIASVVLGIFLYFGNGFLPKNLLSVGGLILGGSLIYFISCFVLARQAILQDIVLIRKQFIK